MFVPNPILGFALFNTMLPPIHLDNQLLTELGEIDDVLTHRNLTAEMKPISVEVLQLNPKLHLLRGHGLSQLARSRL